MDLTFPSLVTLSRPMTSSYRTKDLARSLDFPKIISQTLRPSQNREYEALVRKTNRRPREPPINQQTLWLNQKHTRTQHEPLNANLRNFNVRDVRAN